MRLVSHDQQRNVMYAVITGFDYPSELAWYDRVTGRLRKEMKFSPDCGVDVMGRFHGESGKCTDLQWDDIHDETYCIHERLHDLEQGRESLVWLSAMLEHYWQNGVENEGITFLDKAGFETTYN